MHKPVSLFTLVAVAIVACWWWLGSGVPMPPSPLDPGEKLYCVSYAPFRGTQTPLDLTTRIDARQIEQDLAQLAKITDCVRIYAVDAGLDQIPEIAQRHGLKVLLGLWVSSFPDRTQYQITTGIAIANRYPDTVRAVIVGNEALLRGEVSVATLREYIASVKAKVKVPVTYADVWEFWIRNRELASAVDFVTVHILPYWEDDPIGAGKAADHVASIRRHVAENFSGKEIMIGEFGWPSAGRMRESALPSPADQARVIADVLGRGKEEGFPRQPHRGVRPAVEALPRRHGRRALGLVRRRVAAAEIRLGRAGVEPSELAPAGDRRRGAGGSGVCRGDDGSAANT